MSKERTMVVSGVRFSKFITPESIVSICLSDTEGQDEWYAAMVSKVRKQGRNRDGSFVECDLDLMCLDTNNLKKWRLFDDDYGKKWKYASELADLIDDLVKRAKELEDITCIDESDEDNDSDVDYEAVDSDDDSDDDEAEEEGEDTNDEDTNEEDAEEEGENTDDKELDINDGDDANNEEDEEDADDGIEADDAPFPEHDNTYERSTNKKIGYILDKINETLYANVLTAISITILTSSVVINTIDTHCAMFDSSQICKLLRA